MQLHLGVAIADRREQFFVVVKTQFGIEPTLHQNLAGLGLVTAKGHQLVDFSKDLLVRQNVALDGAGCPVKGTEVALDPADIGVVDIAADIISDDLLGVLLQPRPMRQHPQLGEIVVLIETAGILERQPLPGVDLFSDIGNHGF